ncbi:hypothetical protein K445DRAFT_25654 [Daldinia sp. EC12]|nr:hypothetical protein K445DRAFT_25654 [Daldinia sp. EC12]
MAPFFQCQPGPGFDHPGVIAHGIIQDALTPYLDNDGKTKYRPSGDHSGCYGYLGLFVGWSAYIGTTYARGVSVPVRRHSLLLRLVAVLGGAGLHITQLEPSQLEQFSRIVFAAQVLYAVCLGLIKLSIARCLQRIFFTREFRIASYIVMGFSVAWTLQTILIGVLICQPVELNWDPTVRGTCGDQEAGFTSVAIVDIVTDLMLLLLPIKPLISLRIKTSHKVALLVIFGAGLITMVASAIRLYITFKLDYSDLPYSTASNNYLSTIQPGIAIMVACSPLLKPIFDRVIGPMSGTLYSGTSKSLSQNLSVKLRSLVKSEPKSTVDSSRPMSAGFEQLSDCENDARSGLGNVSTCQTRAQAQGGPYSDRDVGVRMAISSEQITVTRQAIVTSS